MNIVEQVVSLGVSKKLAEAGYPQEGVWWWAIQDGNNRDRDELVFRKGGKLSAMGLWSTVEDFFVAPTVVELGLVLPSKITIGVIAGKSQIHYLYTAKSDIDFTCFYAMYNGQTRIHSEDSNTEADARAKLWLWLKENGYLEVK